jgi:hypothetical protein
MASSFFLPKSHENPDKNPDRGKSVRIGSRSGLVDDLQEKSGQ